MSIHDLNYLKENNEKRREELKNDINENLKKAFDAFCEDLRKTINVGKKDLIESNKRISKYR